MGHLLNSRKQVERVARDYNFPNNPKLKPSLKKVHPNLVEPMYKSKFSWYKHKKPVTRESYMRSTYDALP